jgi:hypothetical protein
VLALALTLLLVTAGLALAHALSVEGAAARGVFAGIVACAAIVGVETSLGAVGALTRPIVVATEGVLAAAILAFALARLRGRVVAAVRVDVRAVGDAVRTLGDPALAVLVAVAVVVWAWVLAAIVFLPPRSVDDLCNHLPPVFEAIVRGRFVLLPLDLRPWFAYPLNADLLSLWAALLARDITWVDGVQVATAALAALAVVALARDLGASRRSATLGALVLLLMPVTLKQATSCYTDVTLAAFYGGALWGGLRWARSGGVGPLVACGLGTGLLAGTKYHFLIAVLALVPVVVAAAHRRRAWAALALGGAVPAVLLGGYWYARDLIVLGNPFYPFGVAIGPVPLFPTSLPPGHSAAAPAFLRYVLRAPSLLFTISLRDLGVGGIDGGFGPLFWGAVVPVAAIQLVRGAWSRDARPLAVTAVQFFAAVLLYFGVPVTLFEAAPRYFLGAAVPGLALLAVSLDAVRRRWPGAGRLAVGMAVAAVVLATTPIAGDRDLVARKQVMQVRDAAEAARRHAFASPWRFIARASYNMGHLAVPWDLLDLASAPPDGPVHPLWVYATGPNLAGFYGTKLQNRIWNLDAPDRPAAPDVLVYVFDDARGGLTYFGEPTFRWSEDLAHDGYDPVLVTIEVAVLFRHDVLARDADVRERVAAWLEATHGDEVRVAATLVPGPADGTIVAAPGIAAGLKALELRGSLRPHVLPARSEQVDGYVARARVAGPVYLAAPAGQTVGRSVARSGRFELYEVSS